MPQIELKWNKMAAEEAVFQYNVYQNDAIVSSPATPELTIADIPAGTYKFEVSAVNILGEGPKSDPVAVVVPSAAPSKVIGMTLAINVNVNLNVSVNS
jgi:predicted phage tail protein